ncbi:MAG: hypothetical protein AAF711_00670 [Planctomycetota bacterium]
MTQLNTATRVTNSTRFEVYVKPAPAGQAPAGGVVESAVGGDDGWQLDERFVFVRANYRAWPGSSSAVLQYVPIDGVIDPFEFVLFNGQLDMQVRVVMYPRFAGTSYAPDTTGTEVNGLLIFDGMIQRNAFGARGHETEVTDGSPSPSNEEEGGSVIAVDAPTLDNRRPEHLVTGRWVNNHATGGVTPELVDGLSVPTVFNAKGKPNQAASSTVEADAGGLSNVTAKLFSADADPRATYWTVKDALRYLIVCWFYGIADSFGGDAQGALERSSTLEPDTYDALFGPTPDDPRFDGLDLQLPEVNVHGLGIYDAIERVCRAAGFRCAIQLPMGRTQDEEADDSDRLHLLRVWRAGSGYENELRLVSRDSADPTATAEQELDNNNFVRISGIRDASRVVNHVIATGRTLVEVTVPLKPLFSPDDFDDLGGEPISQRQQAAPTGQTGDTYYQRHVADGREFNDYAHVGRLWGLDETGVFEANSLGFSSGAYAHDQGGFDWLDYLGIDGQDSLSAARAANGVTSPIRSIRRKRQPLRLSRPELVARSQAYVLEVSEDSGTVWYELPPSQYRVLTEGYFGVMLTARNLAMVNRKTFGAASENAVAIPNESWLAMMKAETPTLGFRLTCLVDLDFAARYDAAIDPGSLTVYPRTKRLDTPIIEVWQSPSSMLGNQTWSRIDDGGTVASAVGANRTDNLKDVAERTRDELSQVQYSVTIDETIRIDPSMFQVGDRITGVAGRNVDFDNFAAQAGETTYPSVVATTIVGLPERSQRQVIDIGSEALRRGA